MNEPAKVLTIAGSDSGGAAGLQADLKTWTALAVYGMSVITAVTAQNSLHVQAAYPLPLDIVAAQLEAVLSDYGAAAAKTGFMGRADLIEAIATWLHRYTVAHIVIDPVLVNHRGEAMFGPEVTQAYGTHLFPLATCLIPNLAETALLTGQTVTSVAQMAEAARYLTAQGPASVLIKGGREGKEIVDVLFDGTTIHYFRSPYLETRNTHGSGDTLSAAVCAYLAKGAPLVTAVGQAHQFTARAIYAARQWRLGGGHGPVGQGFT